MVMQSGFDKTLPAESIKNGLEVEREYTDTNGKPIRQVKLGSQIEVHLRLRATNRTALGNVVLVDLLPGGFEVVLSPPATKNSSGWLHLSAPKNPHGNPITPTRAKTASFSTGRLIRMRRSLSIA